MMSVLARLVYGALARKERRSARASGGQPPATLSPGRGQHLGTGRHGETLVYWYLRRNGYTMVARNRPGGRYSGELDLVGWDGPVLAFVEVKTRTSEEAGPPELALQPAQQERIVRAARNYMRRLKSQPLSFRFDVASVSWHPVRGFSVRLTKNAFEP